MRERDAHNRARVQVHNRERVKVHNRPRTSTHRAAPNGSEVERKTRDDGTGRGKEEVG